MRSLVSAIVVCLALPVGAQTDSAPAAEAVPAAGASEPAPEADQSAAPEADQSAAPESPGDEPRATPSPVDGVTAGAERPLTASDVADAPKPHEASGQRVSRDDSDGPLWIPRVVFFPVRWGMEVVMAPPRFVAWAFDRFQVTERWKSIFFNDTGTLGIFPVFLVETGFGFNAGGRFFHRDLFGHKERLRLRASYGGQYRQFYSAKLTTGELLGEKAMLTLEGDFRIFPKSLFFGIGNNDSVPPDSLGGSVDALESRDSARTRFRHDDTSARLALEVAPHERFRLRLAGSLTRRIFRSEINDHHDPEVTTVYAPAGLVGYEEGLENVYGELEATYDSRRTEGYFVPPASPSTGWKLSGFVGYRKGLEDDPSQHARYGLDIARYFNLYGGDRVLILRTYLEGVTGSLDEVAFLDLPRLGGPVFLRGYDRDRFRDRVLGLATVEYTFPLDRNSGGYLFVDAGRVWRSLDRMRLEKIRMGFGGGLQMHTINSFLARLFIASSIDGGLFFNLSFDPSFDVRSREESP